MIRQMRDYFRSLQEENPEIKYFVFSNDEKALRDRISGFDDFYMFVDYGEFDSVTDSRSSIQDGMDFGVAIAIPLGSRNLTLEEIAEYQLQSFDLCVWLRARMWADQYEHPYLQYLSKNHQIAQYVAPNIGGSVGHVLMFKVQGPDLLNVKKRLP